MSPRRRPVLLVSDDDDDARARIREALEDAGYVVIEAASGRQALDFLITRPDERIGLLILDLQMPMIDSWHLLDLLRCYLRLARIPVIVVTAQEVQLVRLRHPNVIGCFREPFELQALVAKVAAGLAALPVSAPRIRDRVG